MPQQQPNTAPIRLAQRVYVEAGQTYLSPAVPLNSAWWAAEVRIAPVSTVTATVATRGGSRPREESVAGAVVTQVTPDNAYPVVNAAGATITAASGVTDALVHDTDAAYAYGQVSVNVTVGACYVDVYFTTLG